jgi:hypothetical protein
MTTPTRPHRNRVTPFGEIVATPARGLEMGNRGVLHDAEGRLVRTWQVRRWIACRLEFRGRHRAILQPNRWTELFFLDEATALAAGHRPCAECRRADHMAFRDAWIRAHGGEPRADDIDRVLHTERLDPLVRGAKRTYPARRRDLPDGAIAAVDGEAHVLLDGELVVWTPFGYTGPCLEHGSRTTVDLLTPPSTVAAIRAGYRPSIHSSASGP